MAHCANCEALRERVARLERELGLRQRDGEVAAIMRAFDISSSTARVLAMLYAAGGMTVCGERLISHASIASDGVLRSCIGRARHALPEGSISTDRAVGYRLTPLGVSAIFAAVQPVGIQDARAA